MNAIKHLPRFVAALLFAATASTAVVVGTASNAGAPATSSILASAPQAASAAVVSVGFGVGPHRFYRYGWRDGAWVRFGYGYGYTPGWFNGYYLGYAAPVYGYPYYYARGYRPYYYGRPYYGRPYGGYYGRPAVSVGVHINSGYRYGWRR